MGEETDKVPEHDATPVPAAAPRDEVAPRRSVPARERALLIAAAVVAAVLAGLGTAAYRAATATRADLGRLEERVAATLAQQRELQAAVDTTQARAEAVRREVDQKLAEHERGLQAQRQGMAQHQIRLDEEREHARQQAVDLNEAVAALHRRVGRDSARWMVAEAEYLMQVAQQRLLLAQDPLTALEALRLADRRLQETGDPGWIGVRELLAEETAALASLRVPDIPAAAAQLAALAEQAAALQPRSAAPPATAAPAAPGDDGAWRRVLRDGWEGFRSLVVVRRHDKPPAAMLPPDQAYFLGQTLRLQIETARLALLRADPASYRGSLDAARQLLATYFDPADPSAVAVSAALERLAGVDLRPQLPDVTRSLRALRARDRQMAELQDRKAP